MIAILGNPVNRAYSGWQMYHSFGHNPNVSAYNKSIADYRTFAEAIGQELNPQSNTAKYPYDYLDRGKYAEQLENYYQYFDRKNILILQFEQFRDNLDSILSSICNFLNIDNFSEEMLGKFRQKKHNVGKYEKTADDLKVIEMLKDYFVPFNEKLYELLGYRYNW